MFGQGPEQLTYEGLHCFVGKSTLWIRDAHLHVLRAAGKHIEMRALRLVAAPQHDDDVAARRLTFHARELTFALDLECFKVAAIAHDLQVFLVTADLAIERIGARIQVYVGTKRPDSTVVEDSAGVRPWELLPADQLEPTSPRRNDAGWAWSDILRAGVVGTDQNQDRGYGSKADTHKTSRCSGHKPARA